MTIQELNLLWPEIVLLIGAVACLFCGMSRKLAFRRATTMLTLVTLLVALFFVRRPPTEVARELLDETSMPQFIKMWMLVISLLLWTLASGLPGKMRQTRENDIATPLTFDPAYSVRGEFFGFFLFSLAGAMLCVSASDLAWLFLALELTSLPTYVLVATMRDNPQSQESGVKYFFLGAMAAAIFLYGFTLIYGATGSTVFREIHATAATLTGNQYAMLVLGVSLSVIGIGFKIAAFPMYFYTADVYQGAATPVTTFLAFVPKTAGMISLVLILGLVGWPLPEPITALLWVMAAATMIAGNVLGLLQSNVKRALAYSSVAHSGYMIIGLIAGTTAAASSDYSSTSETGNILGSALGNGLAGVLFYLIAYGFANFAAFAVLGCIERGGDEAQTYDDLSGLVHRDPKLAVVMLVAMLSLLGIPPLVGFLGKVYIFEAAINTGSNAMVALVVLAVICSAVSAVYYLRIASVCFFGQPVSPVTITSGPLRITGAGIAALAAVLYGLFGAPLVESAHKASHNLSPKITQLESTPTNEATASAQSQSVSLKH